MKKIQSNEVKSRFLEYKRKTAGVPNLLREDIKERKSLFRQMFRFTRGHIVTQTILDRLKTGKIF